MGIDTPLLHSFSLFFAHLNIIPHFSKKKIATSPKFVFADLTEYPTSQKKIAVILIPHFSNLFAADLNIL